MVSYIDTRTGVGQCCCMLLSYTFRMDDKIEVKDCEVRDEPSVQERCCFHVLITGHEKR